MNTEDSRRAFLGSAVFGIPLLAAGSAAAFARSLHPGDHGRPPAGVPDPLLAHIEEQFVRLLSAARTAGTGIPPDQARAAITYLQVLGVHGRKVHLDERARRALQARIDTRGRDAIIQSPLDLRPVQHMLGARGIDLPDRVVKAIASQPSTERTRATDTVLSGNTSAVFTQMASVLAALMATAPEGHGRRPAALAADGMCDFYLWQMMWYFAIATGFCGDVSGDPALDSWCVTMWSSALFAESLYWYGC